MYYQQGVSHNEIGSGVLPSPHQDTLLITNDVYWKHLDHPSFKRDWLQDATDLGSPPPLSLYTQGGRVSLFYMARAGVERDTLPVLFEPGRRYCFYYKGGGGARHPSWYWGWVPVGILKNVETIETTWKRVKHVQKIDLAALSGWPL